MNFESYLNSIRKSVKSRECSRSDWNWTSGGCFAFASAFVKVFGGKEFGICVFEEDSNDYPVHHAIVKYHGKFYDSKGEVDMKYWPKRFDVKKKDFSCSNLNNN